MWPLMPAGIFRSSGIFTFFGHNFIILVNLFVVLFVQFLIDCQYNVSFGEQNVSFNMSALLNVSLYAQ